MIPSDTALPFDDIRALVRSFPAADAAAAESVRLRDATLTKPPGSLGRLEEIAVWLASWQRRTPPRVDRPLVAIFAGNHGVAAHGVSAYPAEVTAQMVENFAAGGAAINQICGANDIGLKVFDLALDLPTADIASEAALTEKACAGTMAFGMESLVGGVDLLCVGEMGIGNTTVAAAVCCGLFGGAPEDWIGPGTGVDQDGMARKRDAVATGMAVHAGHLDQPLEVLRRLGGRELAAIAGAIIAARHESVPVIVDGFVASAAAAVIGQMGEGTLDHCLFAHVSAEPGHRRLLERLGKQPLLDLGMRLGEGTGAALAATIVRTAARTHAGMATFGEAGVSQT